MSPPDETLATVIPNGIYTRVSAHRTHGFPTDREETAAQAALRLSEIRYRRLFETTPDGVLLLDPRTRKIIEVNPFLMEFLGRDRDEFLGRELWEIGLLRDPPGHCEMFAQLQDRHFVHYEELPIETKDGTLRQVEVVVNLYEEDTLPVVQCHIRDISRRKAIEKQKRISERRYRRLFQASRDGILILDPATRQITDVNPFMCELLGYTHAEFLGRELWEIGLLRDEQVSQEAFRELNEKGYIRYENLPLETKLGVRREVEFVSNCYTEGDQPVIQCNIRDITERKRTELELAAARTEISRHTVELEQTIAERTTEVREALEELQAFSYSISHDMRSPLRAMEGFAQILAEKHASQLDAEGMKYVDRIRSAAGRMDNLIQEVLTYTRVLHGDVKMEPVDLEVLVRQVIDIYPQLQADGVNIHIDGRLPKVLGGEASLAQCIHNLLTNAVKFVRPGLQPQVKIWAEAVGEKGGTAKAGADGSPQVRVWVEDNGIGIARENHLRIFKMFEQLSSHARQDGTGMGLTIVRKAVQRMGGALGVESELGRGSRFWIQLQGVAP